MRIHTLDSLDGTLPAHRASPGDGIYADSQEKPSAARARRERRKRQGIVQTPVVPDVFEDGEKWFQWRGLQNT